LPDEVINNPLFIQELSKQEIPQKITGSVSEERARLDDQNIFSKTT